MGVGCWGNGPFVLSTPNTHHLSPRRWAPPGEAIVVDILQLLDELEEEVRAARRMPIGGGVVVDRRRMSDLIEALRVAIPANVRQARTIIERGEQAVSEADAAAGRIIADAEREAEARVAQSELMRTAAERARQTELEAEERARRILAAAEADAERRLAEAEERARAQEDEADRYALAILNGLDERVSAFLVSIRDAKGQMGA